MALNLGRFKKKSGVQSEACTPSSRICIVYPGLAFGRLCVLTRRFYCAGPPENLGPLSCDLSVLLALRLV